jgi:hypothetical protein
VSDCGLIDTLFRHLPRGTEENHDNPQDSLCTIRDWNRARPDCMSEALLQDQPADLLDACNWLGFAR